MKTVGNDLVRHQLHENRKWYLGLGILLTLFGIVLLASLPFATLSAVFLFGALMMIGGIIHFIAAFKIFDMAYKSMYWLQINKIEDELKYTRNYEDLPSRYQSIYRSFIDKLNFSALDESKISSSLSGASYVEKSLLIMSVKDMMKYKNHNISYKMFYDHVYNETNHKEWEKIERKYKNLVLKFDDRAKNYDRLKREAVFNDFSDDKLIDDALTEFEKSFYDLRKYYVDTVYSEHDN